MENIFHQADAETLVQRIGSLTSDATASWGSMTVDRMLAHCCKPFETVYDPNYARNHPKPNRLVRGLLRLFVKPMLGGAKPYKHNIRTAPEFVIADARDFATEQGRLVEYVRRVHQDGAAEFEGKESHSFGHLTATEWSALFYKHTDHHTLQFGV